MGKKMGRPRTEIDMELVKRLANIQCTISEIASIIDVPLSTLSMRPDFLVVYKNACEGGKASLRRIQWAMAEKSAAMAIWLGKQYLGQVEKIEVANTELTREDLEIITKEHKTEMKSRISQFIEN